MRHIKNYHKCMVFYEDLGYRFVCQRTILIFKYYG